MYNWTFNTHIHPSLISSYLLEENDDEAEWLEEEYEDYDDDEELSGEDKENADISDADF